MTEPVPPVPVALITGAGRRLGASIAEHLHRAGHRVLIHCLSSHTDADALAARLNQSRPDSARVLSADLNQHDQCLALADATVAAWGRLDVLVNNASRFYPTPVGTMSPDHWQDLSASNLLAPLWLSQALAPELAAHRGCILNLSDVHARGALKGHTLYGMAKAGLEGLTRSLALELAPEVRVNAIAPGVILWPEHADEAAQQQVLDQVPLGRPGAPDDIARAALFLIQGGEYITGQVLAVDGGRSLGALTGA